MTNIKRVLLVDDDEDDQLFFIDAIRQIDASIECHVVNNGAEALKHLRNAEPFPDNIFLDLNMPVMNGYECLSEIKKDPFLKEIPVIIFTTSNVPLEEENTKKMGAAIFLSKPSSFVSLKTALEKILLQNILS